MNNKNALVLVWNSFTNDKRVMNISTSLCDLDYDVTVIAAKEFHDLPVNESRRYQLYRVPLFSSLYARRSTGTGSGKSQSGTSIYSRLKENKLRLAITGFLNWLTFNLGALRKALLINPHLVYANDLDTLTMGFIVSRLCNAKLIYDSHEIWLQGNKFESASRLRQMWWTYIEKRLIKKADAVIVTTPYRAQYLQDYYHISGIHVMRNCPRYEEVEQTTLLRGEFKIPSDKVILLYQGLLMAKRGIFMLVDAILDISGVALVFMGMGKDKGALISYIKEKGVGDRVFVKDAVAPEQLLRYTASADIGLQLLDNSGINHYSTISNKLFEYIMAGLAVIASDFPEIRKIVAGDDLGLVVNSENVEEVTEAIRTLVSDKNKLASCKKHARNVRHQYTWEQEQQQIQNILKDLYE
jgi:glycosyltransferase involved in cell wall biosynthesis